MRRFTAALAFGASALALSAPAMAQDEGVVSEEQGTEEPDQGNAIIVTADRREQTLQDFAGTAFAITGEDLPFGNHDKLILCYINRQKH